MEQSVRNSEMTVIAAKYIYIYIYIPHELPVWLFRLQQPRLFWSEVPPPLPLLLSPRPEQLLARQLELELQQRRRQMLPERMLYG